MESQVLNGGGVPVREIYAPDTTNKLCAIISQVRWYTCRDESVPPSSCAPKAGEEVGGRDAGTFNSEHASATCGVLNDIGINECAKAFLTLLITSRVTRVSSVIMPMACATRTFLSKVPIG